jgi:phospholipase C
MMKLAVVVVSFVAMATCEIEHFVAVMFENRAMDHVVRFFAEKKREKN